MQKNKYKNLNIEELLKSLQTSKLGLSNEEAKNRQLIHGENTFKANKNLPILKLFLKQFNSPLMYLLLAASFLSFILKDISDGSVILFILFVNGVLGFFQEYKSENSIAKLEKFINRDIICLRDGKDDLIKEKDVVPGDIVTLKEGDIVPADCRLIYAEDLIVNESQLTGESAGVLKNLDIKNSVIYSGSIVDEGEAKAVVYSIGNDTELGRIADLSTNTKRITKFEKSLSDFSRFLIRSVFIAIFIVLISKILLVHSLGSIPDYLLYLIALSVAVVPEAMPIIITVTLSRGAMLLANKHVIVRTLSAVEDLGDINILCTDKTGTLTMNKQKIKNVYTKNLDLFYSLAIASLENLDIKRKSNISPFDKAFIDYIDESIKMKTLKNSKQLKELPFDPKSRRRRVLLESNGEYYLVVVGSVETLLDLSKSDNKSRYMNICKKDGSEGLRHIALAYKKIKNVDINKFDILENENGLEFLGFVSLEDPLRPSSKQTIGLARDLGISIKILSGDSREVTKYVAENIGLLSSSQKVYTGDEIDLLNDNELENVLKVNNAFARMNPEQKYRIISLLKKEGNVVGYQGDGINDAPSLKLADVSIAVNNATDVAKNSSDIILLKQGLGVMIDGVKSGREIFININKYIRFTFVSNWGNFFALSTLFLSISKSLPIFPVQVLLTSLITDLPCIAVGTDNVDINDLKRPSKLNIRNILIGSMLLGCITAFFEVIFYNVVKNQNNSIKSTALYLFLSLTALIVIFTIRNRSFFFRAPKLSRPLFYGFILSLSASIAVIYIPKINNAFRLVKLPTSIIFEIITFTLIYFVLLDSLKVFLYRNKGLED